MLAFSSSRSTALWRLRNRSSLEVIAVLSKNLEVFAVLSKNLEVIAVPAKDSRSRKQDEFPPFHLQYSCLGPVSAFLSSSLDARCRSLVDFVAEDRRSGGGGALAEQ